MHLQKPHFLPTAFEGIRQSFLFFVYRHLLATERFLNKKKILTVMNTTKAVMKLSFHNCFSCVYNGEYLLFIYSSSAVQIYDSMKHSFLPSYTALSTCRTISRKGQIILSLSSGFFVDYISLQTYCLNENIANIISVKRRFAEENLRSCCTF